ncbi:hypothetical protein [Microbacterium sp. NPDC056234]|uniref:hypothetical protein n=1 Tax=Microbacterium sp. NPDC056234 TaxID=3345757 RepID=UPI0035E3137C
MSDRTPTDSPFTEPFAEDWTIEAILEWFAVEDTRLSDASLRAPLRTIEESLTGSRWTVDPDASPASSVAARQPAVVSLVRSIALHVSRHPALRAHTVADVLHSRVPAPEGVVPAG